MISALALGLYTLAAATAGAKWLQSATWTRQAPRLGILAWLSLSLNVVVGTGLTGLAMIVGLTHLSLELAALIDTCASTLLHAYDTPGGTAGLAAGSALLAVVAVRLFWSAARTWMTQSRVRQQTAATTDLVGHRDIVAGATVLDHETPYAFCVPGRHPRIVITSAAVASLNQTQLRAVLAHESAHLQGRHHQVLSITQALVSAFPWIPAFRLAASHTAALLEVLADDRARREVGREALSGALASLARTQPSPVVLAATAIHVEHRLARLSSPLSPLRGLSRLLAVALIIIVGVLPFGILATPAAVAIANQFCLLG